MQNESKIGGILSIISGAVGVVGILMIIMVVVLFNYVSHNVRYSDLTPQFMEFIYITYGVMGIFLAALGILAIIGGVFALRHERWGWALAGAIASIFTFMPCGIVAVVLIAKSQAEFKKGVLAGDITTGKI
jgi:uncharacterized BrkB/YihY/UPF0761 family membrane protein